MFTIIGGDGKEYGPVTTDQIRVWLAAGRANLDTKAKIVGSDEWRRLGDFSEFSGADSPPIVGAPMATGGFQGSAVPAGRGARTGAAFINLAIYLVSMIPGSVYLGQAMLKRFPEVMQGRVPDIQSFDAFNRANSHWILLGLSVALLLQALLLTLRSQNLGMLLCGIKVVRVDNEGSAGFLRGALLRFLLPVALILYEYTSFIGLLFLVVDYFTMFRADGRCLHDLIAGTKVVKVAKE